MKAAAAAALDALRAHRESMGNPHLRDLFAVNPDRFRQFSLTFEDLTLDYSKNRITDETVRLPLQLADESGLRERAHDSSTNALIRRYRSLR